MPVEPFVDELLSFLERRETRLLSWGFYDISFRPAEVERAIAADGPARLAADWVARRAAGEQLGVLLGRMADAGLLYRPEPGVAVFRTRFGEGVRLLARLRQMFRPGQWSTGPTLVSDIKLHVQRRRYPRQDQTASDCWSDLSPHSPDPGRDRPLFEALATSRVGTPLTFAGFQRRSFSRVFTAYGRPGAHGTVVSAGTGAGKTKAFYVPSLLRIAGDLDKPPFTKIVAIYPRNVLLADQLREALSEAAKLAPSLARRGLRPIRFGALLGQTPWRDSFDQPQGNTVRAVAWNNWERVAGGYRIPFLRSPTADTDLVWRDDHRAAGRHCLCPLGGGGAHVAEGVLAFTRDELLREPPDVLFLSAEMLNREMGNPAWDRVLGLRQPSGKTPRLLLLDEVHAYEGIPGAQVAWVLRRWRHWARPRSLHVVGLSATLSDPVRHLAAVSGLRPTDIEPFAPDEEAGELCAESQEYNLLVKGDAGSGASLLSTTIQTGMLLTRLLTPLGATPSAPADPLAPEAYFARKVFGFTDNLDVVNRWLSDLVDAEQNLLLAALRLHPAQRQPPAPQPSQAVLQQMDAAGQIWELPRRIGHDLTRPLPVGRCTSQTPGLNTGDVLTVATSTLEVGYDDPEVGGVILHKSPASLASFVQRKGRAGRRRGTRPWTVAVLSDFGRDRWDFQQAERLFSPRIAAIRLPTANPYVLRIQAAYFLLDWLGRQVGSHGRRGPFHFLTYPTTPQFQGRVAAVLRELLELGPRWEQFREELAACLRQPLDADGRRLSEAEVDAVIWHAPRPLLREVIPTLYRKLSAGWRLADPARGNDREDDGFRHPLPGILPQATFDDLDAADVVIQLPGTNREPEFLGVDHAMFETCPGRASKRYTLRPGEPGNWHPLSDQLTAGELRVPAAAVYPGAVALGPVGGVEVFQPVRATLVRHAPTVTESSFGSWEWESSFREEGESRHFPLPSGTAWANVFGCVEAFLHSDRACVEVTRYAGNCQYELLSRSGNPARGRVVLERNGDEGPVREAVGFRLAVDAIRVNVRPEHLAALPPLPPETLSRFRVEYFIHLLRSSAVIGVQAGRFQADLLGQTAVAMLAATALRQRCSLRDAQPLLANVRPQAAVRVMQSFFQTADVGGTPGNEGRVRRRIRELWTDSVVAAEVIRHESVLWAPPDADFTDWCRWRYVVTLANAVRSAIANREDNVAEDDLMADVDWGPDGGAFIYITELSPGGLGLIEQVWRRIREDPSAFADGLDHAVDYCPRCENTAHLLRAVAAARDRTPPRRLARSFRAVRAARDVAGAAAARHRLAESLRAAGLSASRDGVVSLVTRLLGPGSSPATDALLYGLNRLWRRREAALGISIDARVFSYLCVNGGRTRRVLRDRIRAVGEGRAPSRRQLFALVQQMLLLDCPDSCPECLDQPNRYAPPLRPSRGLARHNLGRGGTEVSADDHPADWPALVRQELSASTVVRLRASSGMIASVATLLPDLLAEEVEAGFLLLPIRVRRVDREGTDLVLTLDLRDAVHG